ncbi:MAG: sugar ABC transporter substrate-binding protein [Spirochaeta sp.]|nr:sugar ABC transporter substrate-binding protein [Spirochaeta sp.]
MVSFSVIACTQSNEPADRSTGAAPSDSDRELHLLANDHPWVDHIRTALPEFTAATGITVNVEVYPEEQFRTKRTVEMLSGISDIDVFMIMPGNSLSEYHQRGWVEPLDPYFDRTVDAVSQFDRRDFFPGALAGGVRDGAHYSIPLLLETSILAYNADILATYDLIVPTTMDELYHVAGTVSRKSEGRIIGITMRGRGASATSQWVDFLHSFGGDWVHPDGSAAIDSPESIAALRFYGDILRKYGPRDAAGNGWYESLSLFARGEAAMIFDANVFRTHYEDRSRSEIVDAVGYAMIPAGPAGAVPHTSHWGLAIYPGSGNKDAAWLFIRWATAREQALRAHRAGIPAARESVWNDPAVRGRDSESGWIEASTRSYEVATHRWNPPVVRVDDARASVGEAIVAAILGQDVAAAAARANDQLNTILDEERDE